MKRSGLILYLLAGLVALLLSVSSLVLAQGPGEVVLYQENFDSGQAQGWTLENGWAVTEGALCGEGHKWARSTAGPWSNYRVQFRLKLARGTIHLNYRVSGPSRYFIGFHQGGLYLSKQTGPNTFFNDLARQGTTYSLNEWHQVEIAGQGGHLQVTVDGTLALDYTDAEPLTKGGIAFETLDDSAACIDDIIVYGPAPPPTPTPDRRFTWVRTGGPLGGLGYDVRMRPDNPDVMYVTDAWAGVFMSTDGGQTWFPSNQGITTRTGDSGDAIPVFCLTIDPHNYDIIWVGTQFLRGIFKSTDGGHTWVKMDKGVVENEGITFRGFTVDPRDSNVVYAQAEISSWTWSGQPRTGREFDMTQGVVYKTTDGGKSWKAVWRGDNLARYSWIDPRNPDVLYVSTGIFDREAANSVPNSRTPGGVGIIKSTDGGRTWTETNNGLANTYIGTLFMHPTNPDILLAGAGNNQYHEGGDVYLSTDGGASWQRTLGGDGDIITSVEFSLSNPDIAYAGSANRIYRSQDGGRTWQRVSSGEIGWGPPGVRAGFPIDFQVDPRDPNRIFANEYGGGNFLSADGGRTWTVASKGYTGAQVRDIAVDPTAAGRVFAAGRSGIFLSTDGGDEWIGLNYLPAASMEWNAVAIDPRNPQHVLAANNWNNIILQSHDGGRMWRETNTTFGEGARVGWRVIAFAPSDPTTVYAGTAGFVSAGTFDREVPARGIYVSRDGGATWTEANTAISKDAHVTSLAVDSQDPHKVYATTSNHGVLRSSDGGRNWTAINQGLPGSPQAFSIAIHPADSNIVYAGLWRGGLYRSTDDGGTWQSSAAGMSPEANVSAIVFDPTNPQVMYAADLHSGVYRSDNGGTTWTAIVNGLRMRAVNALAISADGQHLYAATEGEGVFRLDLNGQPPPAAPAPVPPTSMPTLAPTPIAAAPTAAPLPPETGQPLAPTLQAEPQGEAPQSEALGGWGIGERSSVLPLALGGVGCCSVAVALLLVGLAWAYRRRT